MHDVATVDSVPGTGSVDALGRIDWGDVPTWLSTVTSLLALTFAALAVVVARRTFRIESERDRVTALARDADEARARQLQASAVSAWWGQRSPDGRWGLFVRNASQTPVYQSHLTIVEDAEPDLSTRVRLAVVVPSDTPTFHPGPGDAGDRRVAMTFTDAAGVRWLRDRYGRLTELAPRLTVWGAERMESVLEQFVTDFHAEYGVQVACRTTDWSARLATYLRGSADGTIGDVLDAPHDWIPTLVAHDVIEPIVLTDEQRALLRPWTVDAVTFEGRCYGVPLTSQIPVLLRNQDLMADPPGTFEDLLSAGQDLVTAGRCRQPFAVQTESFHLSTLFVCAAGEPFTLRPGSAWDPADRARAEATATAALARLCTLGELGALQRDTDEHTARGLFLTGGTPFLIGLSEDLSDARAAGIRCAASPVPGPAGGAAPRPLLSVRSFLLTRRGANRFVARDLVPDYLGRTDVARRLAHDLALPSCLVTPPAHDADIDVLRGHPNRATPLEPDRTGVTRAVRAAQVAAIAGGDPSDIARRLYSRLIGLGVGR